MRCRNPRGLGLVELIVGLAVIAIALISGMQLILSTHTVKQTTREQGVARELAAGEVEALKARARAHGLSAPTGDPAYPLSVAGYVAANPLTTIDSTGAVAGTGARVGLPRAAIRRSADATNSKLYNVTVRVEWLSGATGRPASYSTSAFLAR